MKSFAQKVTDALFAIPLVNLQLPSKISCMEVFSETETNMKEIHKDAFDLDACADRLVQYLIARYEGKEKRWLFL